jgi:hypothetical protein
MDFADKPGINEAAKSNRRALKFNHSSDQNHALSQIYK